MKKILLFLLCGLIVAGCGSSKKAKAAIDQKVIALADMTGATVESVTLDDGLVALKVTFENGILFDFNKSTLSRDAKASLDKLVNAIADLPGSKIRVYGHTDNIGTAEANQAVSAQRAEVVAKYLQSKGIEADRITSKGLSFDMPVADNDTEEGRAKNRRVEIYVIPAQ